MYINKIQRYDEKCYADTDFLFFEHSYLITGDEGTGKTDYAFKKANEIKDNNPSVDIDIIHENDIGIDELEEYRLENCVGTFVYITEENRPEEQFEKFTVVRKLGGCIILEANSYIHSWVESLLEEHRKVDLKIVEIIGDDGEVVEKIEDVSKSSIDIDYRVY